MGWMQNIIINGLPRTGKTTRAVNLFLKSAHATIFFNIQGEDYLKHFPQIYTAAEWTPYKGKCVFTPSSYESGLGLVRKIYSWQKDTMRGKDLHPLTIILDEIWKYQDGKTHQEKLRNIQLLTDLFSAGLRWNIQVIGTAQLPSMVHPNIYKNTHIFIFYQLNNGLYNYFSRTWKIDLFGLRSWLNKPYHYVIYDGRRFYPMTPEQN